MPTVYYLIMFCLYSDIENYFDLKCQIPNIIMDIDNFFFGEKIYDFLLLMEHWSLDIFTAITYLAHFSLPFFFTFYLLCYKKENSSFLKFILAFGLVNFFGVLIQYLIPTPPPWMYLKGAEIISPEANFARVDSLLYINLFKNIYSKNTLVCGAFPSLHTAWPTIILFIRPWFNRNFCKFHVIAICFSAVYSGHHYIIDVLFGFILAAFFAKISSFLIDKRFTGSEAFEIYDA